MALVLLEIFWGMGHAHGFFEAGEKCQLGTPVGLARQGRALGAWHTYGFNDVEKKHWGKGTQVV